jgi:hypothetical protein
VQIKVHPGSADALAADLISSAPCQFLHPHLLTVILCIFYDLIKTSLPVAVSQ